MSERADRELVLVTGATRELGREVCHLFAGDDWDLIMVADHDLDRTAESLRNCGVHVRAVPTSLASVGAASDLWSRITGADRVPDVVVLINLTSTGVVPDRGRGAGLLLAVETELAPVVELVRLAMSSMISRGAGEIMIITEPAAGVARIGTAQRASASVLSSMVRGWQQELDGSHVRLCTHTASGTSAHAARSSFELLFRETGDGGGLIPRFRALTRATRDRLTS